MWGKVGKRARGKDGEVRRKRSMGKGGGEKGSKDQVLAVG